MPNYSPSKNLLYGVLALKDQYVSPVSFVRAAETWCHEKETRSLDEVMLDLELLTRDEHDRLAREEQRCLASNDHDAEKSLAKTVADFYSGASDPTVEQGLGAEVPWADAETWTPVDRFCCDHQPFARGGQGAVFRALDRQFDRVVAVKKLLPGLVEEAKRQAQFAWETTATGRLQHPGIAPVFARGQDAAARPYYAMKLVEGDNLWKPIRDLHRGNFPYGDAGIASLPDLLRRFWNICETIEYAHSRNILHLDLKPSNIMLGKHGETVVLDWGLAKISQDLEGDIDVSRSGNGNQTQPKDDRVKACGTPVYMAPEQWDGNLTRAADIFGLGATLYCLLTGREPFHGKPEEIRDRSKHGDFPPPRQVNSKVPRPLEAICLKAMQVHPQARYASAQDLADDVRNWLDGERLTAWTREPLTERVLRWSRRHQSNLIATAVSLVGILTCLTVAVVLLANANGREREAKDAALQAKQLANTAAEAAKISAGNERRASQFALDTIDNYYVAVGENILVNQPGMEPLRRDLLEAALQHYQARIEHLEPEGANLRKLATAHFRVARIIELTDVDGAKQALAAYEDALEIQEKIARDTDKTADLRAVQLELSTTWNAMGRVRHNRDELESAKDAYSKAEHIRRQLYEADPNKYRRVYANSLMNKGLIALAERRHKAAQALLEKSQSMRKAHTGQPPVETVRDLGKGHRNLAVLFLALQETGSATTELAAAIEILERLLESNPHDPEIQWLLGDCLMLLGNCHLVGQPEAARDAYERALSIVEALTQRNPYHVEHVVALGRLHFNLANSLRALSPPQAELVRRHVEDALRIFQSLPPDFAGKEHVLRDTALSLMVKAELSSPEEAAKRLQDAQGRWEVLISKFGSNPEYESLLKATTEAIEDLRNSPPDEE